MAIPIGSFVAALALTPVAAGAAEPDALFESSYTHSAYNIASGGAVRIRAGKIKLDLTCRERWLQVLGELRALGINHTTPLVSYGARTIYPSRLPELEYLEGWRAFKLDGLRMLLDACQELDIACCPAFWFPDGKPALCERAITELIERYGTHPSFAGVVPGGEAAAHRGTSTESYVALCRLVKRLKPSLVVMDYPLGPWAFSSLQTIMDRSLSGQVDTMCIQFHPSDRKWQGDFVFARGLFHLAMGLCPGIRSIVHTHYKYGGGRPWIRSDDLYRVHQAAVLTATPHGTSIYSFLHAMWGTAAWPGLDDPMPRRLAWYKGIVTVQRMAPYLENARPASAVAIMVPRHVRVPSLTFLPRTYVPLARAGIGAHFFVNQINLGDRTRAIIVPGLHDCSPSQARLIEGFVKHGGTACLLPFRTGLPDHLSPRALRILGAETVRRWEPAGLDPVFTQAVGFDDATGTMADVSGPRLVRYGRGTVCLLPAAGQRTDSMLVAWARQHVPGRLTVEGLGSDFTVDLWHKTDGRTDLDMVMLMGTKAGARAENVKVSLSTDRTGPVAYVLQPDAVDMLPTRVREGGVEVTVPSVSDEFTAIILTRDTYPFLVPQRRVIRCTPGQCVDVRWRLVNTSTRPLRGTGRSAPPAGWELTGPATWEVDVAPGGTGRFSRRVRVPLNVVRRPHFVRVAYRGLVQRVILFPEDGRPQTFSDRRLADLPWPKEEPAVAGKAHGMPTPKPPRTIGEAWLAVDAADPKAQDVYARRPGVCFFPNAEWDPPAVHKGKVARYGERLPRVGAPNFLVTDPPDGEIELRVTYWSASAGSLDVYDGTRWRRLAELPGQCRWTTVTARVPREIVTDPKADRRGYPGRNLMFAIDGSGTYVHRIEVHVVRFDAVDCQERVPRVPQDGKPRAIAREPEDTP